MTTIINTTANAPMGNWQSLGVVMGVAVTRYNDLSLARDEVVEQHHGRITREARESALARMNARAAQMGADAVVGIRFDSVVIFSYEVECTAYGTALKLG